jgi:putative transposase
MPHTYAQNAIHVVFSTKDRAKLIPKDFQPRLWSYAAGICRQGKIFVHAIGGMDDHIHLLIQIPPSLALAKAVNAVKSNSSRWANEEGFPFAWQHVRHDVIVAQKGLTPGRYKVQVLDRPPLTHSLTRMLWEM